jgi:hypothetical protein
MRLVTVSIPLLCIGMHKHVCYQIDASVGMTLNVHFNGFCTLRTTEVTASSHSTDSLAMPCITTYVLCVT